MISPDSRSRSRSLKRAASGWITAALLLGLLWSLGNTVAWADALRYRIQPEASEVSFNATSRWMNAEGRFHRLSAEVTVDPKDLTSARISVSIEAASIDTGIGMRDSHLRSEDFFDVKKFPAITFESQRVEGSGRRANVYGQLTIHGVTREVEVPVEIAISDVALMAKGEFVINRRDYGMNYQSSLNPVGNDVRVQFTFRARAG